jgi:hypothetical protein
MARSQRLSEAEVRRCFRLVGEICEAGDDPQAWRLTMAQGVSRLVGASKCIVDEERVGREPSESAIDGAVVIGFDTEGLEAFADYMRAGGFHIHPFYPFIQPRATTPFTRRRCEIVDDPTWYRSDVMQFHRRTTNMDDTIHSRQPIPRDGWSNMFAAFRDSEERKFSVRERRLVHLVHEEVARLWWRPTAPDPADALPPRLGQIVHGFRAGRSEKQVALDLGLTRQTVHAYAKALHKRAGVSNRFDLLTAYAAPRPRMRPRLSFELLTGPNGQPPISIR